MQNSKAVNSGFLEYIGGLRGLAILMIVLFHLLPEYFSQGYLGVEIFLVISGYLLFRSWKEGEKINFLSFTEKKIVRIVPSLCVLSLVAVVIFSIIALSNENVLMLGKSSLFSVLGVSNYYYEQAYSDYFAAGANMNPLLHTWYLSVTLQVYALWALGAVVLWKVKKNIRVVIVLIIALVSFFYDCLQEIQIVLNHVGISGYVFEDASYYGTVNRLWQVLAGGCVFLLPQKVGTKTADVISSVALLGLLVMAYGNRNLGAVAPLIIVGLTVLLLYSLPHSRVRKVTELSIFTVIGKISFSLYLVHFPVIVFYKQWERELPDVCSSMQLILIIAILSILFWFIVERRKIRPLFVSCLFAFVVSISFACSNSENFARSLMLASKVETYPSYQEPLKRPHPTAMDGFDVSELDPHSGTYALLYNGVNQSAEPLLALGRPTAPPEYLLVGDSNAQHLFSGLDIISTRYSISGGHLLATVKAMWDTHVEIAGVSGYRWTEPRARSFLEWLNCQRKLHTVVVSQLWSDLLSSSRTNWKMQQSNVNFEQNALMLRRFCEEVKKTGKHVVLVMPSPRLFNFSKGVHGTGIEYATWLNLRNKIDAGKLPSAFIMSEREYRSRYSDVIALFEKWENEGFCDVLHIEKGIFRYGDFLGYRNGVLRVRDATHITPTESIEILQAVKDDFVQIINKNRKSIESVK